VDAGIGTGARDFPGDGKGCQVEIGVNHVLVVQAAFGGSAVVQVSRHCHSLFLYRGDAEFAEFFISLRVLSVSAVN
jgi:hypothetical protein